MQTTDHATRVELVLTDVTTTREGPVSIWRKERTSAVGRLQTQLDGLTPTNATG